MTIFTLGFVQCRPFQYTWDKSIAGGSCLSIHRVLYTSSISTLLINAAVVGLPLPVLWGLQMKKAHKVALIVMFSLGSL